jgi:hypothetical protein
MGCVSIAWSVRDQFPLGSDYFVYAPHNFNIQIGLVALVSITG